jgi:hypothetical protein
MEIAIAFHIDLSIKKITPLSRLNPLPSLMKCNQVSCLLFRQQFNVTIK